MRHLGKTPPFRTAGASVAVGSIAEIGYRRLGGVDQWLMIGGQSVAEPPLILLHRPRAQRARDRRGTARPS